MDSSLLLGPWTHFPFLYKKLVYICAIRYHHGYSSSVNIREIDRVTNFRQGTLVHIITLTHFI